MTGLAITCQSRCALPVPAPSHEKRTDSSHGRDTQLAGWQLWSASCRSHSAHQASRVRDCGARQPLRRRSRQARKNTSRRGAQVINQLALLPSEARLVNNLTSFSSTLGDKLKALQKRLRTDKDECPHCHSQRVSSIGGGAHGSHSPTEWLYQCQEPNCRKVYIKVQKA